MATSHMDCSFHARRGPWSWADAFAKRWRDKGFHVLDKLHVLVAPFSRVVWLDADVQVARNVDELCSLDDSVGFAAAHNVGAEARTCFHPKGDYLASERCTECQHHHISQQEQRSTYFTSRALKEDRRRMPKCTYEYNTGVMVVKPLSRRRFRKDVLEPLTGGQVSSSDKADQGTINHLVHARHLFGSRGVATLNNSYNAITRVYYIRSRLWSEWDAALLHHTNSPKPWRRRRNITRTTRAGNLQVRLERFDSLTKRYRAACPISVNVSEEVLTATESMAGVGR